MKNLTLLAALLVWSSASYAAPDCAALKSFSLPTYKVAITKTEVVPAAPPLPAHCRVDGTINARIGAECKPYAIGFGLALPVNWNQRFLFQGGGGYNGLVRPPVGVAAVGANPGLARGFAVVSTDTGHTSERNFDRAYDADHAAHQFDQLLGHDQAYAGAFLATGLLAVCTQQVADEAATAEATVGIM